MEPPKTKIRFNYTIVTKVLEVKERFKSKWVESGGWGKEAKFEQVSLGWYLHLEGSYECLYFGETEPDFKVGDKIKIIFERIDDAKPSQPPV